MGVVRENRYGLLLAMLLLSAAVGPFVANGWWFRIPTALLTLFTVATALYGIWSARRKIAVAILGVLGLGVIVANSLSHTGVSQALPLTFLLDVLFMGVVLVVIFLDILRERRVSMNTVFGACCIYILLALVWAGAFGVVEWLHPGSFALEGATDLEHKRLLLVYHSFVTLTTVGYGDIVPLNTEARTLAVLEAVVAQLYLAIIIARLVGLELAGRMGKSR